MFPNLEDVLIPVTIRLWITDNDLLIRKSSIELDMEVLSRGMEERMREYMKGMKLQNTYVHNSIKTNPAFSDSMFTFEPPKGVRLVKRFGRDQPETSAETQLQNKPAPDFTLPDTDLKEISLSEYKGKVVFVNFWATWRGPCVRSMPDIQALYEKYADRDFAVLGINSMERDKDAVPSFIKEHNLTFSILLDSSNEVSEKYGVRVVPASFLIDKKGVVRQTFLGPLNAQSGFEAVVEKLLEE